MPLSQQFFRNSKVRKKFIAMKIFFLEYTKTKFTVTKNTFPLLLYNKPVSISLFL